MYDDNTIAFTDAEDEYEDYYEEESYEEEEWDEDAYVWCLQARI